MAKIETAELDGITVNSDIIETVVGSQTKFKGSVTTDKPFRIDGVYEGDIKSESNVIISESGSFDGTLTCKNLLLYGTGKGKVTCTERMEFASSGVFKGDIIVKNLTLMSGSIFDGTCKMSELNSK